MVRISKWSNNQWVQNDFVMNFKKGCSTAMVHGRSLFKLFFGDIKSCPIPTVISTRCGDIECKHFANTTNFASVLQRNQEHYGWPELPYSTCVPVRSISLHCSMAQEKSCHLHLGSRFRYTASTLIIKQASKTNMRDIGFLCFIW